jgi:hypothetical protein
MIYLQLSVQLEKRNPTYEPAYSPLLNGVWEIVSAGIFSPGLIGYKVLHSFIITTQLLNINMKLFE